jgi:DNA-binding MarR family transcriptional regulator
VEAPAPVTEKSTFKKAQAKSLTDRIKKQVESAGELFIEAYQGRIWLALDYASWSEYLNGELGDLRPRLPKAQRLELVSSLKKEAKMSQTAIAEALGVDQKTVSNDLKELREAGAEVGSSSVGVDGVERSEGEGRGASRRKSTVDRVTSVFDKLDKSFGDLTELQAEDDWDESVAAVASRHRADVARMLAQLNQLQAEFNEAPEFEG